VLAVVIALLRKKPDPRSSTALIGGGSPQTESAVDEKILRSYLNLRVRQADEIVQRYAALLADGDPSQLRSESSLPAPAKEIADALIIVLSYHRIAGILTDETVQHFRASYGLLSTFVPSSQVPNGDSMAALAREWKENDLSGEALRAHARRVVSAMPNPDHVQRSIRRMAELFEEFDSRWLESTSSESAAT